MQELFEAGPKEFALSMPIRSSLLTPVFVHRPLDIWDPIAKNERFFEINGTVLSVSLTFIQDSAEIE